MKKYNVIRFNSNLNKFEYYDILPYFMECYNKLLKRKRPKSFNDIKEFILLRARYKFWSKCEYEIVLKDWPNQKVFKKWDIYNQIEMNIDNITELFINNIIKDK